MTAKEKAELEVLIKAKIARTEQKVEELREMVKPYAPENSIGRVSRMDAMANQSVMKAALRADEKRLDGLRLALANINDPDFGLCRECKAGINPKRMLLMPESRYCIKCAR